MEISEESILAVISKKNPPSSILPSDDRHIICEFMDSYSIYNKTGSFYLIKENKMLYDTDSECMFTSIKSFMECNKIYPYSFSTAYASLIFIIIPRYEGKFNIGVYYNESVGYILRECGGYGNKSISGCYFNEKIELFKCDDSPWVDQSGIRTIPDIISWLTIFNMLNNIVTVELKELPETYYDPEKFYRINNHFPRNFELPKIGYDTIPIKMIITQSASFNIVVYEVMCDDRVIGYTMYSFPQYYTGSYELKWNEDVLFFSDKENINNWMKIFASIYLTSIIEMSELEKCTKRNGYYVSNIYTEDPQI